MSLWSGLKKLGVHLGDDILGGFAGVAIHKAIEGVSTEAAKKVGDAVVKKFTTEDRLEAMLMLSQARFTDCQGFFGQTDRKGAKKLNAFYAALSPEEKDRFERLFGYAWSVMKDKMGISKDSDPTKKTPVSFQDSPSGAFMKHFSEIGNLGETEIALELDKLEKASPIKQVGIAIGKGASKTVTGLASFINGLNGIRETKP